MSCARMTQIHRIKSLRWADEILQEKGKGRDKGQGKGLNKGQGKVQWKGLNE